MQRVTTAVTAAAAIGALLTSTVSIYYTGRSVEATRKQVQIQEQGQVTDRYARAVEQLGSEQINIRLGAIYSLQRLMRDSPADRDTIVQILSSFVRERAKIPPSERYIRPRSRGDDGPIILNPPSAEGAQDRPPTDVQAAVTALGRLDDPDEQNHLINLSGAYLAGADLTDTYFNHANLSGASLRDADLSGGHFAGARFDGADLAHATIDHANLANADLSGARLSVASIFSSDLRRVNGQSADLTLARMHETDLSGSVLDWATLTAAKLIKADIDGASFISADLRGADFAGVEHADTADLSCSRASFVANFPRDVEIAAKCEDEEIPRPVQSRNR